ncbi:dTMP kinase [Erysipelothrix aquatica]|uniref:dTMP kinase n=1 Tax=Erysipelothrix aquatica TaxID=2683714 RepID=UPI003AF32447
MMGLFVSFEGPDGSGKTTITKYLTEYFMDKGEDILLTREPGGIGISEKIRNLILDPVHTEMDDRTEALLYAASRRQHLVEKIVPAVEAGRIVFCDRFVDSSLAYQGYARGIGIDEVWEINKFAIDSHLPDVTIFIDCDPEIGLERTGKRGAKDRLEMEGFEFHKRVYEGYQEVIRRFPDRIRVIDGTGTVEAVAAQAIAIIEEVINERSN